MLSKILDLNHKSAEKTLFFELVETFVTSFVVLLVIYWTIASPERVQGASMEPTLKTNERILVERLSRFRGEFNRGDIVVLTPPHDSSIEYVKRVIAVPGDVIKVVDCKVYFSVGSERFVLNEPYLAEDVCTSSGPAIAEGRSIRLEPDQYLVFGDNRERSIDSRVFGVVSKKNIKGRVIFRFWPFEDMKMF